MSIIIEQLKERMAYLIAVIAVEVISFLKFAEGSTTALVNAVLMVFQLKPIGLSIKIESVLLWNRTPQRFLVV